MRNFFKQRFGSSENHDAKEAEVDYFLAARTWADDYYALAIASRHRYQKAFFAVLGFSFLSLLTVIFLVFHEQVQLIVVHEGSSGYEWISSLKPGENTPVSWLKTRAEIARYINARESYDPTLYSYQAREVALMSSPSVFSDYEQAQDSREKNSPVRQFGAGGYRTVKILNVLQIDAVREKPTPGVHHENLAEVSFELEDHVLATNQVVKKLYTAMVSWRYQGVPKDPERLFKNWDGFEVVKYQIQPVIESI